MTFNAPGFPTGIREKTGVSKTGIEAAHTLERGGVAGTLSNWEDEATSNVEAGSGSTRRVNHNFKRSLIMRPVNEASHSVRNGPHGSPGVNLTVGQNEGNEPRQAHRRKNIPW